MIESPYNTVSHHIKSFPVCFQLYKVYPDMAMMLGLVTFKPPTVSIAPKSANLVVPGRVNVYIMTPKNGTQLAFVLGAVSTLLIPKYSHSVTTSRHLACVVCQRRVTV